MLEYKLVKTQPSSDNIAVLLRDDINGGRLVIASKGVAVEIRLKSIVDEVSRLEQETSSKERQDNA